MAWGYWSATAVDRGRSPRRNTQQTMPVNIIPQSEPPAPSQPQQQTHHNQQQQQVVTQQQCYSPTCRSRCTSPCPGSPCPGSPCESVNSPPQSGGGSGGGGGGGSGSYMIQCQTPQCQQNCGHGGYTSRKESLDRLDSPQTFDFGLQANQLSDILCRGPIVPSIQSANNTLTRGASLPRTCLQGSGSVGAIPGSIDTGDYDVPNPHPYTHHYMQTTASTNTTSMTPPHHSTMSLVGSTGPGGVMMGSRPSSAGACHGGHGSGSDSSPMASQCPLANRHVTYEHQHGSQCALDEAIRCPSSCGMEDGVCPYADMVPPPPPPLHQQYLQQEAVSTSMSNLNGSRVQSGSRGSVCAQADFTNTIVHQNGGHLPYHDCIHYERLPLPVPIAQIPPPPPREELEPAYATVFPNVPSAPGMSCVGEDRSIYRRGARRWRKLYRINGHIFQAKRFSKKASCDYCSDRIWGLGRQGFKCIQCKLLVHKKCHKLVQKHCSNEHVEPMLKERDDLNGASVVEVHQRQHSGDVVPPPVPDYPPELAENVNHQNVEENLEPGSQRQYSLDDFELIRVIGRGSYAKVLMVELRRTRRIYAMKVIKKALVTDDEDIDWVQTEKHVFETASNHPFLVGLHSCFQTPSRLFFVIEFVRGGDLMFHMQRQRRLPEEHARFYAAEISLALNFLHEKGIIYRDLKLDNVLLDHEGHIKLTDYGMCKEGIRPGDTTSTFCGTPNYIAPEILRGEDYGFSVDWWALGVLLFEMLAGRSPFDIAGASENPDQNTEDYLFQVILEKTIRIPRSLSVKAASVLKGFLNKNPADRLGCHADSGFMDIVSHAFFKSIDWEMLQNKQVSVPFKPRLDSERDLANFPPEFTEEEVQLTPDDDRVIDRIDQSEFEGFEYVNPLLMSLEDCV